MTTTSSIFGHKIKYPKDLLITKILQKAFMDGDIKFVDDGKPYDGDLSVFKEKRACPRCGELMRKDGQDPCIANLPGVVSACCGHGGNTGYILFENGVCISGVFTVEYDVEMAKKSKEIYHGK